MHGEEIRERYPHVQFDRVMLLPEDLRRIGETNEIPPPADGRSGARVAHHFDDALLGDEAREDERRAIFVVRGRFVIRQRERRFDEVARDERSEDRVVYLIGGDDERDLRVEAVRLHVDIELLDRASGKLDGVAPESERERSLEAIGEHAGGVAAQRTEGEAPPRIWAAEFGASGRVAITVDAPSCAT